MGTLAWIVIGLILLSNIFHGLGHKEDGRAVEAITSWVAAALAIVVVAS